MVLFDGIASEYNWPEQFILEAPLARLLAYFAQASLRHGNEPAGPTYEEETLLDTLAPAYE